MSFEAMRWAWDQDIDTANSKYVLLALANLASRETATCNPSKKHLAKKTGLATRTVRDRLADLEEAGLVSVEAASRRDGSDSSNLYRLPLEEIARYIPEGGVQQLHGGGANAAPLNRTEPLTACSGGTREGEVPRVSIDKLKLNAEEWEQAQVIMDAFNATLGTKFTLIGTRGTRPTEHLKRIVMVLREHPEVTLEEHLEMIERRCGPPPDGHWWGPGKPGSIGVLYGPNTFPRAIATDDRKNRPTRRRRFANERSTDDGAEGSPW